MTLQISNWPPPPFSPYPLQTGTTANRQEYGKVCAIRYPFRYSERPEKRTYRKEEIRDRGTRKKARGIHTDGARVQKTGKTGKTHRVRPSI